MISCKKTYSAQFAQHKNGEIIFLQFAISHIKHIAHIKGYIEELFLATRWWEIKKF